MARLASHIIYGEVDIRRWEHAEGRSLIAESCAHDMLEVSWVMRGSLGIQSRRNRVVEVGSGEVLMVPAGHEHSSHFGPNLEMGSIKILTSRVEDIARVLGEVKRQPKDVIKLARGRRVVDLGQLLAREMARADGMAKDLVVAALIEALIVELVRGPEPVLLERGAVDRRIARALELIEARFDEPLTVEQLARAAGMSRYHFSRVFREVMGSSPYRYLLDQRLLRSAELLRRPGMTVTEAAISAGFSDLSRFSRAFRAWSGRSPRSYRRAP